MERTTINYPLTGVPTLRLGPFLPKIVRSRIATLGIRQTKSFTRQDLPNELPRKCKKTKKSDTLDPAGK